MASPVSASVSGAIVDKDSGERQIPPTLRADGSSRRMIKIRPGYLPPEDVEVYRNRHAEARRRALQSGPPGSQSNTGPSPPEASANANSKNAKRREARRKAKASNDDGDSPAVPTEEAEVADQEAKKADPPENGNDGENKDDADLETEKKVRNIRKKLRQAKELRSKKEVGEELLPEQIAKVIKITELSRQLEALGFDGEGNPLEGQNDKADPTDAKTDG